VDAKRHFAARLNEALDRAGAPPLHGGRGEWLAEKAGVTKSAASRWLGGSAMPHRKNIKDLATALKCDWVYLETGEHPDAKLDEDVLRASVEGMAEGLRAQGVEIDAARAADVVLKVYRICTEERLGPLQAVTVAKVMMMT